MMLFRWIITAIAIGIAAYIVPGVYITPLGALVLAVVLGLINIFLKPIITLLTLPLTILTLGLFSLVVNALLIMLAAYIVPDFSVDGFWPAFFFAILVSLITALFGAWRR
ncbi:MAG TPA: phage holin family protein [Candidatus Paceibacterota bacterium]|nr:phage holin family protein [Candidatus Paceibacterota bacterium]